MQLGHVQRLDRYAAEEIGSLVARLEAIDRDLEERGHFGRNGARSLLEHKARLSRELRALLVELGATPRTRAVWAAKLAGAGLGAEIRARLNGDRS
jgi:hypothetical protein